MAAEKALEGEGEAVSHPVASIPKQTRDEHLIGCSVGRGVSILYEAQCHAYLVL